jgi:ankyrin repeat protein
MDHRRIARLLLLAGADPDARLWGSTARETAAEQHRKSILAVMRSCAGPPPPSADA